MAKKKDKPKLKIKSTGGGENEDLPSPPPERSSSSQGSPKYNFDLSDGFTHHDVIGIFLIPFKILWALIKLVFLPVTWLYSENLKMIAFWRRTSHDAPMTREERDVFESLPLLYTLTGTVGGAILGLVAAIQLIDNIREALANLNLGQWFIDFLNSIGNIIKFIFNFIFAIFDGIAWFFGSIIDFIGSIATANGFIALIVLALIIIVVVMIFIYIKETEALGFITKYLRGFYKFIVGSPSAVKTKLSNAYRSFNTRYTSILVGRERIETRTQAFFKMIVFSTMIVAILIFVAGIYVSFSFDTFSDIYGKVGFYSFIMFLTGTTAGWCIGLFARYLDAISRGKYIAESAKGTDAPEI